MSSQNIVPSEKHEHGLCTGEAPDMYWGSHGTQLDEFTNLPTRRRPRCPPTAHSQSARAPVASAIFRAGHREVLDRAQGLPVGVSVAPMVVSLQDPPAPAAPHSPWHAVDALLHGEDH